MRENRLLAYVQGRQVFDYQLPVSIAGEFGIGSFNDSVWFDNVNLGANFENDLPPQAPRGLNVIKDAGP